jgi:hypothetical protein
MPREAPPTPVSLNVVDGTRQHDCVRSRAPYGSDVRWLTAAVPQFVPPRDGTGSARERTDSNAPTAVTDTVYHEHLVQTDTTDNS